MATPDFEKIKGKILPILRPLNAADRQGEEYARSHGDAMVLTELEDVVLIGFTIWDPNATAILYIMEHDLKNWEVTEDEIFHQAFENLAALDTPMEWSDLDDAEVGTIVMIREEVDYNASRFLMPQLLEAIAEKTKATEFVILVPNRNEIHICPMKNELGLGFLGSVVLPECRLIPNAVLYSVEDGDFTPLTDGDEEDAM